MYAAVRNGRFVHDAMRRPAVAGRVDDLRVQGKSRCPVRRLGGSKPSYPLHAYSGRMRAEILEHLGGHPGGLTDRATGVGAVGIATRAGRPPSRKGTTPPCARFERSSGSDGHLTQRQILGVDRRVQGAVDRGSVSEQGARGALGSPSGLINSGAGGSSDEDGFDNPQGSVGTRGQSRGTAAVLERDGLRGAAGLEPGDSVKGGLCEPEIAVGAGDDVSGVAAAGLVQNDRGRRGAQKPASCSGGKGLWVARHRGCSRALRAGPGQALHAGPETRIGGSLRNLIQK
jgi:hypothetical protein